MPTGNLAYTIALAGERVLPGVTTDFDTLTTVAQNVTDRKLGVTLARIAADRTEDENIIVILESTQADQFMYWYQATGNDDPSQYVHAFNGRISHPGPNLTRLATAIAKHAARR